MDEKGLGKRLQEMRVRAGFTQQMLCQQAGLSYSTLTKIERGAIKSPSIFTIQSIAATLGVSLDELMGHTTLPHAAPKMQSKSGVRFVYFDINGCLVRFYHQAFTRLAEISGASADVIETSFWRHNDEACRGAITMEEFNQVLADEIGMAHIDWLTYYLEAIEPIEEMHRLVTQVASQYKIGLLSNIMPGGIDALRAHGFIPDIAYDAVIDSSVVKAIKPEATIYEIAAQAAQCQPSEILLIDDARSNLMAAEKQGWHVLWFDDYTIEASIERIQSALAPAQ